jgi:hypothetical protein
MGPSAERPRRRHLAGSLVGSPVVLPQTLTAPHDCEQMVLGSIVIGVMIFLRQIFLRQAIVPSIAAALAGHP